MFVVPEVFLIQVPRIHWDCGSGPEETGGDRRDGALSVLVRRWRCVPSRIAASDPEGPQGLLIRGQGGDQNNCLVPLH